MWQVAGGRWQVAGGIRRPGHRGEGVGRWRGGRCHRLPGQGHHYTCHRGLLVVAVVVVVVLVMMVVVVQDSIRGPG